ncbi:myosin head motor domain-containing protein TgMyo I [Neospora caninum Liverpool]|uniref:Myosin head motor domain-containing protein TgMyo I n=1 Tax=Neospora caninum (strain Liverpool) TaxID=572307 RepID=F0VHY7_NEOCL|nr:myosin head motor domain-containing protein TgMyo I [Neospora caninum Liverpool]CBZ53348.1 myosin head motor domain-containing protein TgMyo I [Neospora caninum Liverpool]|eukprot:XP_003883380.1 myosin head motor domain-containing protein TgMyo I [Neospora caninum Liverpool]
MSPPRSETPYPVRGEAKSRGDGRPRSMSVYDDAATDRGELLGSWFWVEHPTKLWTVARLAEIHAKEENGENALQGNSDATCVVEFQEGGFVEMRLSDLRGSVDSPSLLKGVDDLLSLGELTEASLLHSLRTRFSRFDIYTAIGPHILLSINPCEPLPALFDEAAMDACHKAVCLEALHEGDNWGSSGAPALTGAVAASPAREPAGATETAKPHIFITAQHAHSRLFREGKCQSIIISGESGSGKTEGTKLILQYLAHLKPLDKSAGTGQKQRISLEDRVLRTNPVLEAFGNAKTCRNDNSSRFGKFTLIYFEPRTRRISAAGLSTYLLETCRLVGHSREERNFHVFYQLVDGAKQFLSPEFRAELRLSSSCASFSYLTPQGPPRKETGVSAWTRRGRDDLAGLPWTVDEFRGDRLLDPAAQEANAASFRELLSCFRHLGFSKEERENVLRVLAAILHLGNVRFEDRPGGIGPRVLEGEPKLEDGPQDEQADEQAGEAEGKEESQVETIARLLCIDAGNLYELFRVQKFIDPVTKQDLQLPRTADRAAEIRDTLAKYVYNHLFSWLVCRLNQAVDHPIEEHPAPDENAPFLLLSSSSQEFSRKGDGPATTREKKRLAPMTPTSLLHGQERLFVGLLDIYGFEVFEANSFEQLCINYANEKLQQHFNHHIFSLEQAAYAAEGIAWEEIQFTDNQGVIDALERKVTGLFAVLDSENIMPRATDRSFLRKILASKSNEQPTIRPAENKLNAATHFSIVHYAGPVEYSVEGFLEKNRSSFSREIADLVSTSTSACLQDLTAFLQPREEDDQRLFSSVSTLSSRSLSRCLSSAYEATACTNRRVTKSVSAVFKDQVRGLLETIEETDPFYVRCIKPSAEKGRGLFDSADVLRQLRCAGVLETVRIRRDGYPVRLPFSGFLGQFSCLASEALVPGFASPSGSASLEREARHAHRDATADVKKIVQTQHDRELCQKLLEALTTTLAQDGVFDQSFAWQVGKTKVFLKKPLVNALDRAAAKFRFRAATCISKHFRGFVERRRYRQARAAIIRLQARFRGVLRFRRVVQEFRERRDRRNQDTSATDAEAASFGEEEPLCTSEAETGTPSLEAAAAQRLEDSVEEQPRSRGLLPSALPSERDNEFPALLTGSPHRDAEEPPAEAKHRPRGSRELARELSASSRTEARAAGAATDTLDLRRSGASSLGEARGTRQDGDSGAGSDAGCDDPPEARNARQPSGRSRSHRETRDDSSVSGWSVDPRRLRSRSARRDRDANRLWRSLAKTLLANEQLGSDDSSSTRARSAHEKSVYVASESESQSPLRRRPEGLGELFEDVVALRARLAAVKQAKAHSAPPAEDGDSAHERRTRKSRGAGFRACQETEEAVYRALADERVALAQEYLRAKELSTRRKTPAHIRTGAVHAGLSGETERHESLKSSREASREMGTSALLARVLPKPPDLDSARSCAGRQASCAPHCSAASAACGVDNADATGPWILLSLALNQLLRGSLAATALGQKLVAAYVSAVVTESSDRLFASEGNGDGGRSRGRLQPDDTATFAALALKHLELLQERSLQQNPRKPSERNLDSHPGRGPGDYQEVSSARFLSAQDAASVYTAQECPPHAQEVCREQSASGCPPANERPGFWARLFRRLRTLPLIGASDANDEEQTDVDGSDTSEEENSDAESADEDAVYRRQAAERDVSRVALGGDDLRRTREARTLRLRSPSDAHDASRSPSSDSFHSIRSARADRDEVTGEAVVTRAEFDQLRGQIDTLQQDVGRCCGLLEEFKVHLLKTTVGTDI